MRRIVLALLTADGSPGPSARTNCYRGPSHHFEKPPATGPSVVTAWNPRPSIEQKTTIRIATLRCGQTCPRPCGRRLSRTQRAAVGKQPSPTVAGCLNSIPVYRQAGRSGQDPGLVSLLEFPSSGQTTARLRIYMLRRLVDRMRKHAGRIGRAIRRGELPASIHRARTTTEIDPRIE